MSINPVWDGSLSRPGSFAVDANKSYNANDPAANLFIDLFGDPMTFDDLVRQTTKQFLVRVDIDGAEYDRTSIVDFTIENSLTLSNEFELGTTVLSKLVLTMKIDDDPPSNARIVPYLAMASNGLQSTDWLPMGELFVDRREVVNGVWTFTCYDKLVWGDVPYVSQLTYPTSMQAVWDEICTRLGYTYDSSVVINPAHQIQAGPAGYSCRQVLGYIASANAACVYVDRYGVIRFRRFAVSDTPNMYISKREYIRVRQTNPVKTYTKVAVVYNTEEGLAFVAGSGDENHTLYVENPFGTQQMANELLVRLNGFSYMPIKMDVIGIPHEMGDRINFDLGETLSLHTVYSFTGGLKMSIEAPSISEQQSEFKIDGELTQQINRLRATAIREGKFYFGLTVTRTEGLTIEREDHFSKVILNSDEFTFFANGSRALWFDLLSKKFKFSGDLEAATGTFGGIYTGKVKTDQLEVGTALISTSMIENLIVGGNVSMGANATISWDKVTGTKPPNNADNTFSVIGTDRLTHITSTGIYTGTITTNQLIAGTAKITTSLIENLIVGTNVTMGSNASIAWTQVTGRPNTTYIDSNGIYTGTLTAQQINVSGINANNITTGSLSGINMSIGTGNSVFNANANGISLGNSSFSSAPFRVTMAGALTATNANITGTINATGGNFSGTVTGGIFQGSTFRTASSGSRIDISDSGIRSYSGTSLHGVQILNPFYGGDSGKMLLYYNGSKSLTIESSSSTRVDIAPWFSNLYIGSLSSSTRMVGNWYFDSSSTYRFDLGSATVYQQNANWQYNTSSVASGGSSTLPSNPVGFISVQINGTYRRIPYYG